MSEEFFSFLVFYATFSFALLHATCLHLLLFLLLLAVVMVVAAAMVVTMMLLSSPPSLLACSHSAYYRKDFSTLCHWNVICTCFSTWSSFDYSFTRYFRIVLYFTLVSIFRRCALSLFRFFHFSLPPSVEQTKANKNVKFHQKFKLNDLLHFITTFI